MKLYNQALSVIDNQSNNFIRTLEEKQFKKILFWNAGAVQPPTVEIILKK